MSSRCVHCSDRAARFGALPYQLLLRMRSEGLACTSFVSNHKTSCRLVQEGGRGADGAVMAADPALSLERIAGAMRSFFVALSEPDTPPEFDGLQVRLM